MPDVLALDKASVRSFDDVGRLHVAHVPISKAGVNPYLGKEIPDYEELGLDPTRVYQLLRDPVELAKAADSFNGNQLLIEHTPVHAGAHQPDLIVGAIGTTTTWQDPYLMSELVVWAREGIEAIESERQKELSAGYKYKPVMEPGSFNGQPYDGRMTKISGNHVALVSAGRAGKDVVVGDSAFKPHNITEALTVVKNVLSRAAIRAQAALTSYYASKIATDAKPDFSKVVKDVTKENFAKLKKQVAQDAMGVADPMLTPEAKASTGATPDDVIMRVLDLVDAETQADPAPDMAAPAADPAAAAAAAAGEPPEADDEEDPKAKAAELLKGLSPEIMAAIKEMCAGGAVDGEAPELKPEGAADEEDNKDMVTKTAMDAAIKTAEKRATDATMLRLGGIRAAEQDVHPLIGDISVAIDSADAVYDAALKSLGQNPEGLNLAGKKMAIGLLKQHRDTKPVTVQLGMDSASLSDRATFEKQYGIPHSKIRHLG
jgi:hypothetical protein